MKKLEFLKSLNSPFKRMKLKFYLGKVQYGVPYFYPRKWVKFSKDDAIEKAYEQYNELNDKTKPQNQNIWFDFYKSALKRKKCVPKKFGFDFVGLGYKTKFSDIDYRFEHGPIFSFVFFNYQFCIIPIVPEMNHYWEPWLYYHYHTDKSLSQKERIELCKKEFPQTYTVSYGTNRESVNYYNKILKKKYI